MPWELGHTVALGYSYLPAGDVTAWLLTLTVIVYGWLLTSLLLLFSSPHKPPA